MSYIHIQICIQVHYIICHFCVFIWLPMERALPPSWLNFGTKREGVMAEVMPESSVVPPPPPPPEVWMIAAVHVITVEIKAIDSRCSYLYLFLFMLFFMGSNKTSFFIFQLQAEFRADPEMVRWHGMAGSDAWVKSLDP